MFWGQGKLITTLIAMICLNSCSHLGELQKFQDFVLCTKVDCQNQNESKIVNGTLIDATSEYANSAVLLLIEKNSGTSSCTAVPIGKQLLLTAAHCVDKVVPTQIQAVFGWYTPSTPPISKISVSQYKIHESYDGTAQSYADLALIKLSQDIPASHKIAPLYDGRPANTQDQLILIGYGITDEHLKDSLVLRMTTKSLKKDTFIKKAIIGFNQKNTTGGFCKGDSGAPVFVQSGTQKKLLAINSFTASTQEQLDCHSASFAMYIPHFRQWIIKQMVQL